jgi:hypothetical protein
MAKPVRILLDLRCILPFLALSESHRAQNPQRRERKDKVLSFSFSFCLCGFSGFT